MDLQQQQKSTFYIGSYHFLQAFFPSHHSKIQIFIFQGTGMVSHPLSPYSHRTFLPADRVILIEFWIKKSRQFRFGPAVCGPNLSHIEPLCRLAEQF